MNFDLEAEKRLALTLVLDAQAWDHVGDTLGAEMFGSAQARAVFAAVQRLVERHQPVTPVTVQAAIVEDGGAGSVLPGWAKGAALSMPDLRAVAARIRELWSQRELARVTAEVAASAGEVDSRTSAARLGELLAAVEAGPVGGAKPIGRLVLDYLEELEEQVKNPSRRIFYETGFKALDAATGGFMVGELAVLAARPGNGKSSFVMALACSLVARGIPVGMFWLEDDHRDAARRFLAARLSLEAWRFRGTPKHVVENVTKHHAFAAQVDLPLFVDDAHGLTIPDICARMRRMSREHGVKVFILDHLGEVRIERQDRWGDRHDLALGQVARQYRDTAKELGAVPVLVSQMNRRFEQRGDGAVPQMSDLDGSGQVEQAARHIAFVQLHKDDTGRATGRGSLHLVKCTGGVTGTVDLTWDGASMTWRDA